MGATSPGRSARSVISLGAGVLAFLALLCLVSVESADAAWTPPVTVTEGGAQYSFGQDLGPGGDGMVVWSAPTPGGDGYAVFARTVGPAGELGTKLPISSPAPAADLTSSYAPAVRYDSSGTATVVWLESTYEGENCFGEGEGEPSCEVDLYVKSRQVNADESLGAEQVIYHHHASLTGDGQFGGVGEYVTYGQPSLAAGPGSTLTLVWAQSSFGSGCAAYGYSTSSYADDECEAEESIRWARLSATGAPTGESESIYDEHTTGYGSGRPLLSIRLGAAADGTATVVFDARSNGEESSCWGGESSIDYLRIAPGGAATPAQRLDSGCGATTPDLAVDADGTAFAVWGWEGSYSGTEALVTRISPGGVAETPQTLIDSEEGVGVAGIDVARRGAAAIAVWGEEGKIRSRALPTSGALGPIVDLATPASRHFLADPRIAVAADGTALVAWEDGADYGEYARALEAMPLAADGTRGTTHVLMAANRWDHGARVAAGSGGSFMASWRVSVPHDNRIQAARLGNATVGGNDDFADAEPLDSDLPSFTAGSNEGATKESGEPEHAGDPGGASVWFKWTAAESAPVTLATCATGALDPVLAVYTGPDVAHLTQVAAATGGAPVPCTDGDAAVRFDAVAGTTYRIAVDGQGGSEGSFGLKLISRGAGPINDDFADATQLTGESAYRYDTNANGSREAGEPEHGGDPGGASVWYAWTAPRTASTSAWICGALENPLLGVYTGSAVDSLTPVEDIGGGSPGCTDAREIRFHAVAGTTYRIAVDGGDGREGSFQLAIVEQPANDDFGHAQPLTLPASRYDSTVAASRQAGEPDIAGDPGGASVWYSWTPTTSAKVFLSACLYGNGKGGALLAVYTGSDVEHLTDVAADAASGSDLNCFSGESRVEFDAEAGVTYRIAVDGEGGASGAFRLNLEGLPANDDLADAQRLGSSMPQTIYSSNRHAGKADGEPDIAGDPGGASVWYSWTPISSGSGVVSACLSASKSALLGIYSVDGSGGSGAPETAYGGGAPETVYGGGVPAVPESGFSDLTEVGSAAGNGPQGGCTTHMSEVALDFVAGRTYYIAVDGEGGSEGFFTLALEALPANDDLAHAQALGSAQYVYANNRHATKEDGEPDITGDPGGASVWYSWTPSQAGHGTVSVCGYSSVATPLLGVYTGPDVAHLTGVGAAAGGDVDDCSWKESEVEFEVEAGTTYYIAVDGKSGLEFSYELDLEFEASALNDDFADARLVAAPGNYEGTNRDATEEAGEPEHAGAPGDGSVWFRWTPERSGAYGISVCSQGSLDPLLAVYTGSAVGSLDEVASNDDSSYGSCAGGGSEVRFEAQEGTTYRIAVDGKSNSRGRFELELVPAPANDSFADPTELSPTLPDYYYESNRFATKEVGEPDIAGDPGGASVWYTWTPSVGGPAELSACSYAGTEPLLAVYTGASLGSLVPVSGTRSGAQGDCAGDGAGFEFEAESGVAYRIALDGRGGAQGSFELTLRGTPANDDFADATPIGPALPAYADGEDWLATHEPGEPQHAGLPGRGSVWFEWTPVSSGPVQISICSYGSLDPLLAVYTGSALGSLQPVAADDDGGGGCSSHDSEVRFDAEAGVTYRIAVDGKGGSEGWFELHLRRAPPPNDDFADAIELPQEPTQVAGTTVDATAQSYEPYGDEQSVWYKLLATEDGIVRLHTCSDVGAPMGLAVFTGSALGALSPVATVPSGTSSECDRPPGSSFFPENPEVAFHAVAGTTYRISVDRFQQIFPVFGKQPPGPFLLLVDPPADDLEAAAEPIANEGGRLVRSNVGATHQSGEEEWAGAPGGASVWFRWFADADGPVTIDTCGSAIDTLLAVEGSDGVVAEDDDSGECGPGSTAGNVDFDAEEGETYLIVVDGKGGQTGSFDLNLDFDTPDTTPPETRAYIPTAINTAQLTVSATRDEPGSRYECSLDGAPFAACESEGEGEYATIFVKGLGEGRHLLAVREVDLAGNADPTPVSGEFVVDKTPPETSIDGGAEGLTRYAGSFSFSSSEPGSSFECALDQGAFSYCSSPFAPGPMGDGEHEFKVRATDPAGNRDQSAAIRVFDLDTTPPVATIAGGPTGVVHSSSARFTFSADEPGTFTCRLDNKASAPCESPADFEAIADGDHVFQLQATDTAGNVGEEVEREFHVEAKPPETTLLTTPPGSTKKTSASFTFASNEEESTFECSLDGKPFAACDTPDTVEDLGEGHHIFRVRAVDSVGKLDPSPSESTWDVDLTPPGTAIASGPSGLTDQPGPFEFVSDESGSYFECSFDEEDKFAPCPPSYFAAGLEDGPHVLHVRAVDPAGNVDPTPVTRSFTLDTVPPTLRILSSVPPVTRSEVTIEFEAEAGAFTECRIDAFGFQPCESPIQVEGLADGPQRITVRAVDAAGNETTAATDEFTVDDAPPNTTITGSPPFYTDEDTAEFELGGSIDATTFQCSLDGAPLAPCSSPVVYEGLDEGSHHFRAVASDDAGNVDPTPAEVEFTVDKTPPDTIITSGPTGPVHDSLPTFEFKSTEPGSGFECALDSAPWGSCGAEGEGIGAGDHVFKVRATDRAGNVDPTPAEYAFTVVDQGPWASLELSHAGGAAPFEVEATVEGTDPDGDKLSYEIQFGDGDTATGYLPHAPVAHTYTQPGVYVLRVTVEDGYGPQAVATRTVTVGPPEPLAADAGDDLTAIVGEPVTLDGSNSRPLRGVDGYAWRFGDGASAVGETVHHIYSEPGTYEAKLTVSRGGETASDTASVHVVSPPPGEAIHVTVRGDGTPLTGAEVLAILPDGSKVQALSSTGGIANLHGLPDGSYKVYAYATGYLPATGDLTVNGGAGEGEIEMHVGQLATATLDSHRMSLEEIEAAGIDTSDPANQHMYQFTTNLILLPPGSKPGGESVTIGGMVGSDGFVGATGCVRVGPNVCRSTFDGGGIVYTTATWVPGADAPIIASLVIPFRATFLKEFYEVSMVVQNLADPGFDLKNGTVSLDVPDGMSLAPTAKAQSTEVAVPDIPGGGSATVDWVLRGDEEGEYGLAAHYGSTLEPFGRSVTLDARTSEPIKVWGGSALHLEVDVDEAARTLYPYTVYVKLKDVADVPVYNPAVELLKEGSVGYIEQPDQQRSFGVRELLPGQTHVFGPFIIVPQTSGTVDLANSFIQQTAGDVDLGGTIVTHQREPSFEETPRLEATNLGGQVRLDWDPVPGAERYEVFRTSDPKTPFDEAPVHLDLDGTTAGEVAAPADGEDAWYAVSTIIDGRHTMVHPLIEAPPPPPPGEGKEDALGEPKGECPLDHIALGVADLVSACFTQKPNNVYESNSRVRVNGIDLFPQDSPVLVDVQHARITVARARVQLGNIVLYEGPINWSPTGAYHLGLPDGTAIRGIPVSGSLSIDLKPDRSDLTATAKLPAALGGVSGTLKLGATNEDGPKLDRFELEASGLSLDHKIGIDAILLKYERTAAGDLWEGGATLSIPRPGTAMKVQGRLGILNGRFKSAAVQVDGINEYLAYGVFLQRLRASVAVDPLVLSGGIGLSAGPQILGHEAVSVDGDGSATFGNPQVYEVNGKVKVVDAQMASGYLRYRSSGLVEFGGELGIDKSGFKADVKADGWVDGLKAFDAHGTGTFSVSRASFGGEGVISNVGIAACRRGAGPDVGAGYRWGGDVTFFASSCDISNYESVKTSSVGRDGVSLRVASGEPVEVLAFHGSGAPPQVVLHESDGAEVVTPANGLGIDRPQLMLAESEQDDTTYMAVYSPPGGKWTAETAPGSAPIASVSRAGALPSPQAGASVEPAGEDEALLHWQLRPIPGQRVEFVEESAHGGQVLATTDEASGSARFTPLADEDPSRKIVAMVEQYGLPRTTIPVEQWEAPAAAVSVEPTTAAGVTGGDPASAAGVGAVRAHRPAAPSRVRLRRRGGRVVVSWPTVAGADRYLLRGRFSTGRLVRTTRTTRRLVITGVRPGAGVVVSVRGVADDGRRGAPRTARLRAAR